MRVLLQIPRESREKFSVSVPTIRFTTTLALLGEPLAKENGEEYDEGGVADVDAVWVVD